jgi:hypothetical protein
LPFLSEGILNDPILKENEVCDFFGSFLNDQRIKQEVDDFNRRKWSVAAFDYLKNSNTDRAQRYIITIIQIMDNDGFSADYMATKGEFANQAGSTYVKNKLPKNSRALDALLLAKEVSPYLQSKELYRGFPKDECGQIVYKFNMQKYQAGTNMDCDLGLAFAYAAQSENHNDASKDSSSKYFAAAWPAFKKIPKDGYTNYV